RPQLMSICLNTTGTLKLHLIATWNPLHLPLDAKQLTGGGGILTKSKSFLGSSSSLLSRWTGGASQPGTLSNNYSGLSKSMSSYNIVGGTLSSTGLSGTLKNDLKSPSMLINSSGSGGQLEILDADYFHHPHLFAGSETGARLARQA